LTPSSLSSRTRPPPRPTLFPYTTLFRSGQFSRRRRVWQNRLRCAGRGRGGVAGVDGGDSAAAGRGGVFGRPGDSARTQRTAGRQDRKSTRLNSSHVKISYAVFCLKKKKH